MWAASPGRGLGRDPADGVVDLWTLPDEDGELGAREHVLAGYGPSPQDGEPLVLRSPGKPRARDGWARDLRFSTAHCRGLSLVAVAWRREVGVDVEPLGRGSWLSLPGQVLTPAERRSLEALEGAARDAAFLRLWVRKEALLKAAGVGLAVDPVLLEVGSPFEPPAVRRIPEEIGPVDRWTLVDVALDGAVAAVALEGRGARIRLRRLDASTARGSVAPRAVRSRASARPALARIRAALTRS